MDFHELEAFLALADTLHFGRAAARAALSPSALSRLITRLEEEQGVALFERDSRRVELTEEGKLFREFARESVFRKNDLLHRFASRSERPGGILRIYASVTACYSILPPLVEALSAEHPEVRLSIDTGDPAPAADAVRENRADIAISALPDGGFEDLLSHSVRKTPLVFAAAKNGPYGALALPPASIDNEPSREETQQREQVLENVPLILPRTGLARYRFDQWVQKRRTVTGEAFSPEITAETAGNEALLALARLGAGLALVPRLVLENSPFAEGLVLYRAGKDFGEYDIGFVQKKQAESPAREALLTAVHTLIRRIWPHE